MVSQSQPRGDDVFREDVTEAADISVVTHHDKQVVYEQSAMEGKSKTRRFLESSDVVGATTNSSLIQAVRETV